MELLEEIKVFKKNIENKTKILHDMFDYYFEKGEKTKSLVSISKLNVLEDVLNNLEKIIKKYKKNA